MELDDPIAGAGSDGEVVKDPRDLDMLAKLHLDDDSDEGKEEGPQPLYTHDSDDDSPQQVDSNYDDDYF